MFTCVIVLGWMMLIIGVLNGGVLVVTVRLWMFTLLYRFGVIRVGRRVLIGDPWFRTWMLLIRRKFDFVRCVSC